jgi:hypothetical protein
LLSKNQSVLRPVARSYSRARSSCRFHYILQYFECFRTLASHARAINACISNEVRRIGAIVKLYFLFALGTKKKFLNLEEYTLVKFSKGHLTESGQFLEKCKFQFFTASPLKMRACGTGRKFGEFYQRDIIGNLFCNLAWYCTLPICVDCAADSVVNTRYNSNALLFINYFLSNFDGNYNYFLYRSNL